MDSPPTEGSWRWFRSLVRPWRGRLVLACLSLLLSSAVLLLPAWFAGRVVDLVDQKRSPGEIRAMFLGIILLIVLAAILEFVESWLLQSTSARMLRSLRSRLLSHLLTLTPAFYDARRTGELLSRLNADVNTLGSVLTRDLVYSLQRTLMLAGALVAIVAINARLTGIMLAAVPPVVAAAVVFARRIEKVSKREKDALAEGNVVAEEALSGIRSVQAFVREPEERGRYNDRLDAQFSIEMRSTALWSLFHALVQLVGWSAFVVVVWYGATLVLRGTLTPGGFTAFLMYSGTVAASVGSLTSLYGRLAEASGATARVREILDTKPELGDAPGAKPMSRPRGEVAFEDVRFQYASATTPALDGVSLRAEPGQLVALVGPSGAGKSTLASLTLRFHDPQAGRVTVDGEDSRSVRLADLRGAIGFVPQDVFLFGGTVLDNIRFGKPGATMDEVRAASEAAFAAAFIERLPKKYETVVGERGVRLSAGERQRIAIARVFLKDPAIVLLDEATSALDAESEAAVQKAFERLFVGRTTLVIAHRLATVRRADKVVVLERGKVVETGKHEELLAKGGLYRRLCDLQMLT